jgi:integrase
MNHETVKVRMSEIDDRMVVVTEERTYPLDLIEMALGWTPPGRQPLTSPLSDGLRSPAKAAPTKYTVQQINKLIEDIRAGQPPQLPEGKCEKHYRDPRLPGLYIRLLNTGVASYVVQTKQLGRQTKHTIGNVLVLDRPAAIKAAKDLLAKVQLDRLDPQAARRERMRANKVKFATVAPLFMEYKKSQGLRPSTENHWNSYFTKYYFKPLHDLPIDEITSEQLQTCIDTISSQSGNTTARCCWVAMRVFFKWAIRTGKLPKDHHNPMINIESPGEDEERERVLTDDEIRLIWKACEAWEAQAVHETQFKESTGKAPRGGTPNNPNGPRIAKLLFLTGCRSQEIGELQWPEIDLDNAELKIPGKRRKSRKSKEHKMELFVPLAGDAVKILRGIERRPNDDHVFGRGRGQMSHIRGRIDEWIVKAGGTAPKDWRLHDIRRTFRTRIAALGVTEDIGERLLGHVGHNTKIRRTYNRYDYWAEKRTALALYEDDLRAIIGGTAKKIERGHFGERKTGDIA